MRTHLVEGTVIDGLGGEPLVSGVVTYEDDRLTYVGPADGATIAADDETIDVGGHAVLPGLIDAHVHHIYSRYRNIAEIDRVSVEGSTVKAVANARLWLEAGFTTVRDVGTRGNIAVAMRDAIEDGTIAGPRVVASGQILCTTGGLADTDPAWLENSNGLGLIVDGAEDLRRAVRQQVKQGVDNIKIEGSGAEASFFVHTWMSTMSGDEMAAVVDEARRYGKTVACHAQSYDAAKHALRAGVDTVEHGTRLDEEAIELFLEGDTVLVPTLVTLYSVLELAEKVGAPTKQLEEMKVNEPLWLESLAMAKEAGVVIAAGSDIGNRYVQGDNAKEMILLAEHGGHTPMEAIVAGTRNAAIALRREDSVGSLQPGLLADVLVFDGDPLGDIHQLLEKDRIRLVIQGGAIVAGSGMNVAVAA
ncbi:MAG TPA: amidohydrolase family protein [Solirubrobacteraceae bacterium]|nr:amidohydrolase family protein [Solirubrobacteraceae bacterium]